MLCVFFFFFQAEDGIRDLVRSRGLGDVYKRQGWYRAWGLAVGQRCRGLGCPTVHVNRPAPLYSKAVSYTHLTLPTERSSVDLGGRRIIKKKKKQDHRRIRRNTAK